LGHAIALPATGTLRGEVPGMARTTQCIADTGQPKYPAANHAGRRLSASRAFGQRVARLRSVRGIGGLQVLRRPYWAAAWVIGITNGAAKTGNLVIFVAHSTSH